METLCTRQYLCVYVQKLNVLTVVYVARGVAGPGEERRQLGQLPHRHQEVCKADQQHAAASHHAQGQAFTCRI